MKSILKRAARRLQGEFRKAAGKFVAAARLYRIANAEFLDQSSRANEYRFFEIDEGTLGKVTGLDPLVRQRFESRLALGDRCIGSVAGAQLIYWGWVTARKEYYEPALEQTVHINDDCGYIYDTVTASGHRGKGIHRKGLAELMRLSNKVEGRNVCLLIMNGNTPAIRTAKRYGAIVERNYYTIRLGAVRVKITRSGMRLGVGK